MQRALSSVGGSQSSGRGEGKPGFFFVSIHKVRFENPSASLSSLPTMSVLDQYFIKLNNFKIKYVFVVSFRRLSGVIPLAQWSIL